MFTKCGNELCDGDGDHFDIWIIKKTIYEKWAQNNNFRNHKHLNTKCGYNSNSLCLPCQFALTVVVIRFPITASEPHLPGRSFFANGPLSEINKHIPEQYNFKILQHNILNWVLCWGTTRNIRTCQSSPYQPCHRLPVIEPLPESAMQFMFIVHFINLCIFHRFNCSTRNQLNIITGRQLNPIRF